MSQGLSFESFAGTIDVCEDTLFEWLKVHSEFSESKKIGHPKSRLKWENYGIAGLFCSKDEKFNATVWIFNMKNRFGWRDVQEIKSETNSNVDIKNIDELKSTIERLISIPS